MKGALLTIRNTLCGECSLALRRFVGGLDGVESIDGENGKIAVEFNEAEINEEKLTTITKESMEMLGYKLEE